MEFKNKVVLARAKLNISQTKLANLLHVSLTTISRWENGKVTPTKKDELLFAEFCRNVKIEFDEVME